MSISKEDTWAAADALEARGIRPTMKAVREELGSGSFTTIQPFMAAWNKQKLRTAATTTPMPAEFAERMKHLAEQQWAMAHAEAERQLQVEREALRTARDAFERDQEELAESTDAALAALDTAQQSIASLESVVGDKGRSLDELRTQLVVAETRAESTERLLDQERMERRAAQEALAQAREALARLEARRDSQAGP